MDTLLSRHRNVTVFVVLLFAQVVGLAVQVRRAAGSTDAPARIIRLGVVSAITPFQRVIAGGIHWVGDVWNGYVNLRGTRDENERLKQQVAQLRLESSRQSEDVSQARRLQSLLGFRQQYVAKTLAAQIIGAGGTEQSHIIYIDKGFADHLKPDMPVITPEGVAGKVLEVFPASSQVLLLNDPSSGVGAILEESRLQGVVRGSPSGELLLDKVMADETVKVGERVLTSGGDRIFPKGLLIGTVAEAGRQKDVFLHVRVKPVSRLGQLEEVLVVTEIAQEQTQADANSTQRAIDVLAERLPQVPQKADAIAASAAVNGAGRPGEQGAGAKPSTSSQAPAPAAVPPRLGDKPKSIPPANTQPKSTPPHGQARPH